MYLNRIVHLIWLFVRLYGDARSPKREKSPVWSLRPSYFHLFGQLAEKWSATFADTKQAIISWLNRSGTDFVCTRIQFLVPVAQMVKYQFCLHGGGGYAVAQLVEALRCKPEGRRFDSRWCHWNTSLTSFRPHYGPGVDSASNRNMYQEYFLVVKVASAEGWQPYHLHVPTVLKSGSLNLLEPSGPVQACNGIALPLL